MASYNTMWLVFIWNPLTLWLKGYPDIACFKFSGRGPMEHWWAFPQRTYVRLHQGPPPIPWPQIHDQLTVIGTSGSGTTLYLRPIVGRTAEGRSILSRFVGVVVRCAHWYLLLSQDTIEIPTRDFTRPRPTQAPSAPFYGATSPVMEDRIDHKPYYGFSSPHID